MNVGGGRFVNCLNGVIDLDDMSLNSHSLKYRFTYVNHARFIEGKKPIMPNMEQFCETSLGGVKTKIKLFMEMIGYMCCPTMDAKKGIFIIGPPGCGKSSIGWFLIKLLGETQIAAIPFHALHNQFANSQLSYSRANLDFDLGIKDLTSVAEFKLMTSGDYSKGEKKGGQLYAFRHSAKVFCAGNYLPSLKVPEPSKAYIDRISLLKLVEVPKEKRILGLDKVLRDEIDAIFTHAMYALQRLRDNQYQFTVDDESQKVLEAYEDEIDSVAAFYNACCVKADSKNKVYSRDIYTAHQNWCKDNLIRPFSVEQFYRSFSMAFGYPPTTVRVNGNKPAKGYRGLIIREPEM